MLLIWKAWDEWRGALRYELVIYRTVKHYLAPLERGSRRERIRSGRGLPRSGPTVCWRNDGITCEPQRRPPEATGVVLDEHTFHQTEK